MIIPSSRIPQADVLEDVVALVEAVDRGATTFQEMAGAIGKVDRQGRYYRLAAQDLELIEPVGTNHYQLTRRGAELLTGPRMSVLREVILGNPVFRSILAFVRSAGPMGRSRQEIVNWLIDNTSVNDTTARRRASTVINWLETANLVNIRSDTLFTAPGLPLAAVAPELADPLAPLTRDIPDLAAFGAAPPEPHTDIPPRAIQVLIDLARRERLNARHEELVRKMAERARQADYECLRNQFVDLFAVGATDSVLFEMKTNTQQNCTAQVRRAIGQLYEYQYVHDLGPSKLVVVLSERPEGRNEWLIEYLESARGITVVWDHGTTFASTDAGFDLLPWL